MTNNFQIKWAILAAGPIYQAISAATPFKDLIMLSQTTDSQQWSLTHCT